MVLLPSRTAEHFEELLNGRNAPAFVVAARCILLRIDATCYGAPIPLRISGIDEDRTTRLKARNPHRLSVRLNFALWADVCQRRLHRRYGVQSPERPLPDIFLAGRSCACGPHA